MNKFLSTFIILLCAGITVTAQQAGSGTKEKKRYEHYKERNISRTFAAAGNALSIDNSFGNVTVTTWDRNEIKVDIHIEASSNQKDIAEKAFDNLDVIESKEGNTIKFKTITEKNKGASWSCKNCSNTMDVSYTVQLPSSTALKIDNSFGDIKIPDYKGPVSLASKFGSLQAGTLAKVEKVLVEFGKANLKSVSNVNATFKFSTIVIENLSGNNTIKMEFCSSTKIVLDNELAGLTLNESYSTVNLKPASNLSASYHIRTSFGSLKDRSNANIKRTDEPDRYGPDSERTYEGKNGSGAAKIDIRSSFGTIIIGEATTEEMKEKDKKGKAEAKI
jgi:hypothetical protein